MLIPLAALPAFVLSLIGIFHDSRRRWAVAGLVLSIAVGLLIAVPVILAFVRNC